LGWLVDALGFGLGWRELNGFGNGVIGAGHVLSNEHD
jgi:hypothetical protein